ncbi:MAG TPA: ribosome-associated translation inhibitor RaiA [Thermotogota bacterium]|nr:ribosome-associated translation inhibitor RaiA [Thermotogota bacterium]HRW91586.1 ribosome-associated translation inhibitor RaiA [Thermotogota bacterium]
MDYRVATKGFSASESITDYVDKKVSKLEKVLPDGDHVRLDVMIEREKSRFTGELTLHLRGGVIRTEETTNDLYTSFDIALEAMEKKLRRYKQRRMVRHKMGTKGMGEEMAQEVPPLPVEEENGEELPEVVRTKRFFLRPMKMEEALLQLDMLGHEFFVFKNDESDEINLVYKRKNGTIGLIEFEV